MIQVFQFDNKKRYGVNQDGGYVIAELEGGYDCYISAGVSDEESFSRDFINHYDTKNNFAFDGTILNYPYSYTDKIQFIKKNISHDNTETTTNLHDIIDGYSNIFLKMDIEGGEYPWLLSLSDKQLDNFKQITMEFHGIQDNGWGTLFNEKYKCFNKIQNTHYIIHAHGNNHSQTIMGIPTVIELTLVNKRYFSETPKLNTLPLPSNLDFPNGPFLEFNLNFPPFVYST